MNAFANAQARWDAMTPDDDAPDLRESVDVNAWIETGIEALMDQGDVCIPGVYGRDRPVVKHPHLVNAVVDHMSAQMDQERGVEHILIEIIRRGHKDDCLYKWALRALGPYEGNQTVIHDMAHKLVDAHADEYAEAEADRMAMEREVGF
jgi:hypothetical protein